MRRKLHRIYMIPHADWLEPERRFLHLANKLSDNFQRNFRLGPFTATWSTNHRLLPSNASQGPSGMFVSKKCGGSRYWEARAEHYGIRLLEADPDVISYIHQPHRLEIATNNGVLTYLPDLMFAHQDGRIGVVETKYDYADTSQDPDYIEKLLYAKAAYKLIGCEFYLWTEVEDFNYSYAAENSRQIVEHRHTSTTVEDELLLAWHFDEYDGSSTIGATCTALRGKRAEPHYVALSKLRALIVKRKLGVDIYSSPITADTAVVQPATLGQAVKLPSPSDFPVVSFDGDSRRIGKLLRSDGWPFATRDTTTAVGYGRNV